MDKKKMSLYLAGIGLSAAAALSGGFLTIPHEGAVKDKQGYHTVYKDPVGILTFCYGETGKDMYGREPRMGMKYTEEECLTMLAKRLPEFEKKIDMYVHVPYKSVYMKAQFIDFAYNVGVGAFSKSTLLRYLNNGEYTKACDGLLAWKYAGGKVLPGLVKRRQEERSWCLGYVNPDVIITYNEIAKMTAQGQEEE